METKIKKVLMVLNPVSGNTDKQPIVDTVQQYLPPKVKLTIYSTTGKEDITKLQKKMRTFEPDRILVVGGDGTVKMVAQACQDERCVLGIIPAGSANGLATDLEIPVDCKKALVIAMGDTVTKMDALRIEDAVGLHISDLGINAELVKNYSESAVRGRFGYFLNSLPTLWESNGPYRFSIAANGQHREVEAIMVAFANSKKFGTGALVNPTGEIDDGKFEVLIFKKLDVVEILKTLNEKMDLDTDFVEIISTTDVKVTTPKPVPFQIDGEPHGEVTE
ncbi:MAG TPA: diacylglycerol kinase family protein, partial [Pricia sp.]|nr:diacylglycerol kinase family protein [Pricia sp.]